MPVLNGHETTKVIRDIEINDNKDKRIPIIGLPAHTMVGDREKCLDAGMDDYVTKPIIMNELLASIEKNL